MNTGSLFALALDDMARNFDLAARLTHGTARAVFYAKAQCYREFASIIRDLATEQAALDGIERVTLPERAPARP